MLRTGTGLPDGRLRVEVPVAIGCLHRTVGGTRSASLPVAG
jgi:hypothetical protein